MQFALRRILAALDFSEHSQAVVNYAGELSRQFQADLVFCHVVDRPSVLSGLPPGGEGYFPPNMAELQEQYARAEVEKLAAAAGLTGWTLQFAMGTPFVEIVRLAREAAVDLIIVGTHGRGAVAHLLLGSTAEKIVQKAPCPVLTVRHGEHEFVHP